MGYIDALFNELENVPLWDVAMKEEYYVMMLMSTYGTHNRVGDKKFRSVGGDRIGIKYSDTVHNHYQRIDDMESHNASRQGRVLNNFVTTY